ncbi:MAG: MFS transporter [Chloroflexi bacterium]|nr:MFS transporter [Chloroflexota bacterium]
MERHHASQESGGKRPRLFYGYVIVITSFFVLIVTHGSLYSFGVFLKPLAADFNWTREMTSGAYALAVFVLGPFSIIAGKLTDMFGPRSVLSASGLLLGVGYLLISRVDSLWQLYLLYGGVIAIGMSGTFVPLASTVSRRFVKSRGLMTGIISTGIGVGTMILPPVATYLNLTHGWRTSFTVLGVVALALIIPAAQLFKSDAGNTFKIQRGTLISQPEAFTFSQAIRTRQLWMVFGAYIGFGYTAHTVLAHSVAHATDLGISPSTAASIITAVGGASLAGRIGLGIVSDRVSNKAALITGLSMMAAGMFWLQAAGEMWSFYIFAAILGFGYGGTAILHPPAIAELFGMKAHGQILGLISFAISIGGMAGPLVAGRIYDMTGSYRTSFLLSAIFTIIGVALVSLLKPVSARNHHQ